MAPEWAFREFPHARVEDAEGHKAPSRYSRSVAVSGSPGLCLDNEDVREYADAFLNALASRYKDHPGLGGYDTWNEQHMSGAAGSCWCKASTEKFRSWLKKKYGDLDELFKAWKRYSYRDWDDIEIPRHNGFYGDSIDWILFRIENAHRLMKWRIDTIKRVDPEHPVTAHGKPERMLSDIGPGTYNVFKAGALVDIFGLTGGGNHEERTTLKWLHWFKCDITRSGAKEKPFWAAEVPTGYSWRAHGVTYENGRINTPQDIRLNSMIHFATGVTGIFSPRWRPLLNGPVTGCLAYCEMDGSHTDRTAMAGKLARWSNDPVQKELWRARPVQGEIGIIVVPESQIQVYLLEGDSRYYYRAAAGAYQGFLFNNIQADFINAEDIVDCGYPVLYLPHPMMLPRKVSDDLKTFVRNGGTLISEGCPAYFGDHGRAGEQQPNYGLDELFGAKEARVEFTPVLLEEMKFSADNSQVSGGVYLQAYEPTTGKVKGSFGDGSPAVIENSYGRGKTLLIGTSPGYGTYEKEDDPDTRAFFNSFLDWAGKQQHVTSSDWRLVARMHEGGG
jgi:beta-galactosidase